MSSTTEVKKDLDEIIEEAEARMRREIDQREVESAKVADELAADIAADVRAENDFEDDSDEAEAVITALCKIAGDEFPGNWEDYPKR